MNGLHTKLDVNYEDHPFEQESVGVFMMKPLNAAVSIDETVLSLSN